MLEACTKVYSRNGGEKKVEFRLCFEGKLKIISPGKRRRVNDSTSVLGQITTSVIENCYITVPVSIYMYHLIIYAQHNVVKHHDVVIQLFWGDEKLRYRLKK